VAFDGSATIVLACVAAAGCGAVTGPGGSNVHDASACQTAPPATKPVPECNNLWNVGTPVRAVLHSGDGVVGGRQIFLTDGIYRATALDGYRGAADTEVRDTVAVTQGGTEILWTSQVIDPATGAAKIVNGNASSVGMPAGVTFERSCGTITFGTFQVMQLPAGAFTTITQPPVNGEPVFEETFNATDCAPGD
jgi:hypothetical protein